ncbi:MAG: aconitase family protein, partial [Alphaproteobacteria bacterium]|nr:aconitase family protein [Alphaproteobacteria bacterium]
MANGTPNPFDRFLTNITIGGQQYRYYPLDIVAKEYFGRTITLLPVSIRILLENAIRHGDEKGAQEIINWQDKKSVGREIAFRPARVLLQDFTGVPAIADLAAMRDAMKKQGRDPALINPRIPVDLVIDHSVTVNDFGSDQSLGNNIAIEFEQNNERYQFLKWGQG